MLITLAGIWLGLSAASGLNRRAAALDAMEKLVARIASQIRYTAAPVGELMLSASRTAEFRPLRFLEAVGSAMETEGDFPRLWAEAVSREGGTCGFAAQDEELLREFGKGLGASDTEGQTAHCRLYGELFSRRAAWGCPCCCFEGRGLRARTKAPAGRIPLRGNDGKRKAGQAVWMWI